MAVRTVKAVSAQQGFGAMRPTLLKMQPKELVRLMGELYSLSKENQRFLEARLGDASAQLPAYRQLVADCLFPDPLRKGAKVRIVEAKRAISQYERATGDSAGTVDLMLTFVETGTAFAVDLGYGDDNFFAALENMLSRALNLLRSGTDDLRCSTRPRLLRLSASARNLGWGFGDFVSEAVDEAIDPDEE